MTTEVIRTYEDLLRSTWHPTPYPYGGRAISDGWDGGAIEVDVLAHMFTTDGAMVEVLFPSGERRWLGAAAVALPGTSAAIAVQRRLTALRGKETTRMTKTVDQIAVGDVIMPPPREVSLWMRRHCREHGLSDSAMHLTVTEVHEGAPDTRGRWLVVTADQTAEWNRGRRPLPFTFRARPHTAWSIVAEAVKVAQNTDFPPGSAAPTEGPRRKARPFR